MSFTGSGTSLNQAFRLSLSATLTGYRGQAEGLFLMRFERPPQLKMTGSSGLWCRWRFNMNCKAGAASLGIRVARTICHGALKDHGLSEEENGLLLDWDVYPDQIPHLQAFHQRAPAGAERCSGSGDPPHKRGRRGKQWRPSLSAE